MQGKERNGQQCQVVLHSKAELSRKAAALKISLFEVTMTEGMRDIKGFP